MRKNTIKIILIVLALVFVLYLLCIRREGYVTMAYTAGGAPTDVPTPDTPTPDTPAATCTPPDGIWSVPNPNGDRSAKLASPCCQPPDYAILDPMYKTCANYGLEPDPNIRQCLANCCKNADVEKGNYDPSWYPMAKCGCALWCYNSKVPHFAKHGTAVHYIEGDPAEVNTPDTPAASGSNWRGWIDFSN